MKKGFIIYLLVFLVLINFIQASDENTCNLNIELLNQDPYPATPGEYVKLVFQVDGLESPGCAKRIYFTLLEQYPIEFDAFSDPTHVIKGDTYINKFDSFYLATYKVRVSKDALDGSIPLEIIYKFEGSDSIVAKDFDLEIKDISADFEIFVYDYLNNRLSFEILNTGKADVNSLIFEIPSQEGIKIIGSNKQIVGDLDSNEYTSTDFNVQSMNLEELKVIIHYTDKIGVRRTLEKTVSYNSSYFEGRDENKRSIPWVWIIIIAIIAWYCYRRYKKNKKVKKN
jgi:hypothetical protein